MNCDINVNKRLSKTFDKLYNSNPDEGYYILDAYNEMILENVSPTVTTRFNASNCIFLIEVIDKD